MNQSRTVNNSWSRIESWLKENAPSYAQNLGKRAVESDLATLAKKFGVTFPQSFVDSCMIHAGDKNECDFIPDGFGTFFLLTLKNISSEWKMLNEVKSYGDFDDCVAEPQDGIANEWWSDGWIPFASNGGGDLLCFDTKPGEGGQMWQIVKFIHDEPERQLVASSFEEWLTLVADAIDAGELSDLIEP